MAVVMQMTWDGFTQEQYQTVRELVGFETEVPKGAIYHVASFAEDGAHITDVWETAEDFQAFTENRLMPAIATLGIAGEPTVVIRPAYATFAPGVQAIDLTTTAAKVTT